MGSRFWCWDELPRTYPHRQNIDQEAVRELMSDRPEPDFMMKLEILGRRIAFGSFTGATLGATFGMVEIMRDTKMIVAKKSVALAKITKYAGVFGLFFGTYHGIRKTLGYTAPISPELNLVIAGTACITPLVITRTYRGLAPYAIMLVAIDAINGLNDI